MTIHEAIEEARVYDGTRHTEESYFDVGAPHDIVVSNSSFGRINPDEGGSERKFEAYFEEEEEKATVGHIEKGRILHRYINTPRDFVIEDAVRPSDTICTIIDEVIMRNRENIPTQQGLVTGFDQLKGDVVKVAIEVGWNKNYGEEALFRNLKKEGEGYFDFRIANSDKIIMPKEVGKSVKGMKESIENSVCREYLLDSSNENDSIIYKELPIFWQFPTGSGEINCKSLIDNLEIDEKMKSITITELKTTSKPGSQYMGYRRLGMNPIEGSPVQLYLDGPFQYYRVYRQLASYGEAFARRILSQLKDGGMWSINYRVVAVESKEPYETYIYSPRTSWIRYGQGEYVELLDRVGTYLRKKEQRD